MLNTIKLLFLFPYLLFLSSCSDQVICNLLEYENGLTYNNGKLFTGKCETYFHDFKTRSKQQYLNGKDHGKWIFYFNNGNVETKGEFNMGSRIGEWNYFYESGKIWKRNFYSENGNKIGIWYTYNENGGILDSISLN